MAKTLFVAKAIVLEKNGNFLLLTRSKTHPSLAGFFDLPGGMIEDHEEPGEAIIREVHEETGMDVSDCEKKILYATTMLLNEASYPTLLYMIKIDEITPNVVVSWEHQSAEWVPLSRLVEVEPQIAPTYREALAYIQSNDILRDL